MDRFKPVFVFLAMSVGCIAQDPSDAVNSCLDAGGVWYPHQMACDSTMNVPEPVPSEPGANNHDLRAVPACGTAFREEDHDLETVPPFSSNVLTEQRLVMVGNAEGIRNADHAFACGDICVTPETYSRTNFYVADESYVRIDAFQPQYGLTCPDGTIIQMEIPIKAETGLPAMGIDARHAGLPFRVWIPTIFGLLGLALGWSMRKTFFPSSPRPYVAFTVETLDAHVRHLEAEGNAEAAVTEAIRQHDLAKKARAAFEQDHPGIDKASKPPMR